MSRARDRADGKITGDLVPSSHEAFSLGSESARFNDGFFSASTVDIGGLKISKDTNGDAEFKDGSGAFKKIMASEIHLGTGSSKAVMKRQTDGSVGFATTDNSGNATTAEVGGSTSVYANTSSLPSVSASTSGDMAFVTANKRFYIFNGTAWYSVVLTNTAPTVTGASLNYTLATNGSATVVTLSSSDPEGDPLTFSHTTTGLGTEATITQGTGSNTNVFTVTPSTNEAHAGEFSVVFSATDGANVVNNTSSFTLVFSVPQHFSTSLKVKTSGTNGRTNSVFDDASTGNHTVTANGDVYQTSLTPHNRSWSNYFAGAGATVENVVFGHSSDFVFGTNEWCVESWIFCEGHQAGSFSQGNIWGMKHGTDQRGVNLHMQSNGNFMVLIANATTWTVAADTGIAVPVGEWAHVALTKNTTTNKVYLWVDGKERWSVAHTGSIANSNNKLAIGGTITGAYAHSFKGYISEFRVVVGDDVYPSEFKPSLDPLTAITGTKLLTCNSNRFADFSGGNAKTITFTNTPEVLTWTPLALPDKWKSTVGGSTYFDGTGDYITIPDSADFDLATAWTFETWVYPTNLGSGFNSIYQVGVDSTNGFVIDMSSNGSTPRFIYYVGSWVTLSSSEAIPNNSWSHISVTWDGSYYKIFVNGVQTASATSSTAITNPTAGIQIGRSTTGGGAHRYYTGYLSDTHFVKGTAKYTSAFTPPTALTALHSNTKLKLNFSQAGVFDTVGKNSLKLYGDAQESTTQTKYATTSIKFDGTGDYAVSEGDHFKVRTGAFQFEAWVRWTSGAGGIFHAAQASIGSGNQAATGTFALAVSLNNKWNIYHNTATEINSVVSADTWYHVAYLRQSGKRYVFINGVEVLSAADTYDYSATDTFNLGGYYNTGFLFNGYIEDARFLSGHTTYPNERPQEALTAVSGTTLQLANASTIPSSPNGLTLSVGAGSPTVSSFTPADSTVTHSIRYDGNDRTDIAANTNLQFGTGDFTVEMYLYLVAQTTDYASVIDFRSSSTRNDASSFTLVYSASKMYIYANAFHVDNIPRVLNKWQHLVYQRRTISGTQYDEFYIDGVLFHQATDSTNWTGNSMWIGSSHWGDHGDFYIADLRVNKGNAIYSSSFTPPTASL